MTIDNQVRVQDARAPRWLRILIGAAAGAVIGFGFGAALEIWQPSGALRDTLSVSAMLCLVLASASAAVSLILLAMSFSRRMYVAENWTPEMDAAEHGEIAPQLRLSALALGAMAIEFAALAIPASAGLGTTVVAVVAASVLVQLWANWATWRGSDELYRSIALEGSAISLGLTMLILSLWVPLVVQGLVASDPLMMLVIVSVACTVPTLWLSVRRGVGS